MTAAAPTLPADRPTVKGAPPTFCPLCDGRGRLIVAGRDFGPCKPCDGTGVATCRACPDARDLVGDGDWLVCRSCVAKVAWHCDRCGDDTVTIVPDEGTVVPTVHCGRCRRSADLVTCKWCQSPVERDAVEDDGLCAHCRVTPVYCGMCAGSGEGSHDGARCFACKGEGVER